MSSSPFLLNATIRHHLQKYLTSHPDLVNVLMQSTYVDDIVFGADTEENAYALYIGAKEILSHGSFNLRKFMTNSPTLQKLMDAQEATSRSITAGEREVKAAEETYAESTLPINQSSLPDDQKVLGVRWDVPSDQLVFSLDGIVKTAMQIKLTKRNVVSVISQIYDPLGFLSPVTILFKTLMQELCKFKLGWEQSLEGELLNKWKWLVNKLKDNQPIVIPRCYFQGAGGDVASYRLYGFCDASTTAYAAVIYLVKEADGHRHSSFVTSKTRVAPLKTLSIPRLELLSAMLLARLIVNVSDSLSSRINLNEPKCFTDSQVTLFWIKGIGRDWKPFVQNRVSEIRRLIPAEHWSHCSGKDNPADVPSRGCTPAELSTNQVWRYGPVWLGTLVDSREPALPEEIPKPCLIELKASDQAAVHNLLTTQPECIGSVIDIDRFSSSLKLYQTTAYVLKFVKLLKKTVWSPELTQADLSEAENIWIMDAQSSLKQDPRFPKWKRQFSLFKDDCQVWRCGGRLHNASLTFSAKHPVILPKKHTLSVLIARYAHRRVQHNGVKETLTEVRAKYWIIGGRSLIRSVITKCVNCRRFEGRPLNAPPAPPLPSFQVQEAPPFTYGAVDFAGPMYLRSKGEFGSNKVWMCLFTCCVTCAIHLELVTDMTTTTFIWCLKRFSARRGLPKRILSDNAKTFKAAAKLLKSIFSHQEVKDHLSHLGVEWIFNLEKAPWWGGLFERMIKSTKRCLRKMVGSAKFTYDEMHTAIVEIEAIINSRPLTFLSSDDLEEPLTPSHLLVGRRLLSLPDNLMYLAPEHKDFEVTGESLQKRARHLNSVLNHFWNWWSKGYLFELRETHRQRTAQGTPASVKQGDLVLVHEQSCPWGFWKVAKVKELIVGKDGHIRGAVLKLPLKNNQPTFLQRPIQHLYPPEISQAAPSDKSSVDDAPRESRPQRSSASRAHQRIKEWSRALLEDSSEPETVLTTSDVDGQRGEDVEN